MKKTFITTIPLQGRMESTVYWPEDFDFSQNRRTSFPIISIMENQMEEGDDVHVIAIYLRNSDSANNYNLFLNELGSLGVSENAVTRIQLSEKPGERVGLKMLVDLINQVPEGSAVYADITYGTKPVSALVLYAMMNVEKLRNAILEGIYYGEIPRKDGKPDLEKAALHNLTPFKNLSDSIDRLAATKAPKTEVFISYRRDGGDAFAYLLYEHLVKRGYNVFLDVRSLGPGSFGDDIQKQIAECTDFLAIMSKNCLDRCVDPNDWVLRELECAVASGVNIIPIFASDFIRPSNPSGVIDQVLSNNGLTINFDTFDASIDKLVNVLMKSKKLPAGL